MLDCLDHAGVQHKIAVLGHGGEQVGQVIEQQAEIVYQKEQLGTGHAVMQAAPALPAENDCVLVICGDTPLLRPQTIAQLIARHEAEGNAVTLLTAHAENPTGYGRIVRQGEQIAAIVEQKDADAEQARIKEINTGTYCFAQKFLLQYLQTLNTNNAQKDVYKRQG